MLFIGIDLGTSAVKLLLMEEDGRIRSIVSREYPLCFPREGWSEQAPEDWKNAVLSGLRELTAGCNKADIAAIGVGGQMHGLVVLDEKDQLLRPAILWNDGRTEAETEYLNTEIGKERLSAWTGNIAFAGFTAPKLLWMRRHETALFGKIKKIMLPKDYINYMLSGVYCTDFSDASGMLLLDVEKRRWSREMLEICGICEEQLPRLYESYEVVGVLKKEISEELGFPEGVKLVAGAGDNAAAAIGTGTVGAGACNISLGTSGTIFISDPRYRADSGNSLHAFCHADGGYHLMGCMLSAASCSRWWNEAILGTSDYDGEQAAIPEERLGRNSVYFLPYLMGERAPHNDALARAAFIGMSMDSGRADMSQAVLEGVAFGLRDSLEAAKKLGITVESSMLCGGGARSRLWRRMLSNILNIRLTLPETEQGPGYGAAILAAVGAGAYRSVEEAVGCLVRKTELILPETELSERYEERYRHFRRLYPALREQFRLLAETSAAEHGG